MGDKWLGSDIAEKDLRSVVVQKRYMIQQCDGVAKKENMCKTQAMITLLYSVLARLQIEYYVQFYILQFKKL